MDATDSISFLKGVLPSETGWLRIAYRIPKFDGDDGWRFVGVPWREGRYERKVEQSLTTNLPKGADVYFNPVLFNSKLVGKKGNVAHATTAFVDFDGGLPIDWGRIGDPSYLVETSNNRFHAYWNTGIDDPQLIEALNKQLVEWWPEEADKGGWDITQLLRIPGTFSVKNSCPVTLVPRYSTGRTVPIPEGVEALPVPEINLDLGEVSDITTLVKKYKLRGVVKKLFEKGVEQDRSTGLQNLAYLLCEKKLTKEHVWALLKDADSRWGKFAKRGDLTELAKILDQAWDKRGAKGGSTPPSLDLISFMDAGPSFLPWVMEPFVYTGSLFVLSGPPGVGKSQLFLNMALAMADRESFVGFPIIDKDQKVLVLEMEMNDVSLRDFLRKMVPGHDPAALSSRVRVKVVGQQFYLNERYSEHRQDIERELDTHEYTGILVDSLNSSSESVSEETHIRPMLDFLDYLRVEYGVWIGLIHHQRKMPAETRRKAKDLEDLMGSRLISARPDAVFLLSPHDTEQNLIELMSIKTRNTAPLEPMWIERQPESLHFVISDIPPPTTEKKSPWEVQKKSKTEQVEPPRTGIDF